MALSTVAQQFVIMFVGGLALFMWGYLKGYNVCFKRYFEDVENELETLKQEKEEQLK